MSKSQIELSDLEDGKYKSIVNDEEIIYVGSHGKISAIDVSSSKPTILWKTLLNSYHFNIITIALDKPKNTIHATAAGVYYRLNMKNGEVTYRWEMSNMKAIYSVMILYNDMIVTNSIKKLYSMNKKGVTLWKSPNLGRRYDSIQGFHNSIIVGTSNTVNCIDANNGNILWRDTFDTNDDSGITILCDDSINKNDPSVFVGHCGQLYKYSFKTGDRVDLYRITSQPDFCVSLLINKGILIAAAESKVYAFKLDDLDYPIWTKSINELVGYHASMSLSVISNDEEDYLYVGCNGFIVALNINSNGEVIWKGKIPRSGYSYVSIYVFKNNRLIVGSSGKLVEYHYKTGEMIWSKSVTKIGFTPIVFDSTRLNSDHPIIQTQERGSTVSTLIRSFIE